MRVWKETFPSHPFLGSFLPPEYVLPRFGLPFPFALLASSTYSPAKLPSHLCCLCPRLRNLPTQTRSPPPSSFDLSSPSPRVFFANKLFSLSCFPVPLTLVNPRPYHPTPAVLSPSTPTFLLSCHLFSPYSPRCSLPLPAVLRSWRLSAESLETLLEPVFGGVSWRAQRGADGGGQVAWGGVGSL